MRTRTCSPALAQYVAVSDDLNGLLTGLTDPKTTVDPATLSAAVTTFADLATDIGNSLDRPASQFRRSRAGRRRRLDSGGELSGIRRAHDNQRRASKLHADAARNRDRWRSRLAGRFGEGARREVG